MRITPNWLSGMDELELPVERIRQMRKRWMKRTGFDPLGPAWSYYGSCDPIFWTFIEFEKQERLNSFFMRPEYAPFGRFA